MEEVSKEFLDVLAEKVMEMYKSSTIDKRNTECATQTDLTTTSDKYSLTATTATTTVPISPSIHVTATTTTGSTTAAANVSTLSLRDKKASNSIDVTEKEAATTTTTTGSITAASTATAATATTSLKETFNVMPSTATRKDQGTATDFEKESTLKEKVDVSITCNLLIGRDQSVPPPRILITTGLPYFFFFI